MTSEVSDPTGGERPLLIIFSTGLYEMGGVQKRTRLLAHGFAAQGWDVRVVSRLARGWRFRLRTFDGGKAIEVPGFGVRVGGRVLYMLTATVMGLYWARAARGCMSIQLAAPAAAAGLVSRLTGLPFLALASSSGKGGDIEHALAPGWLRSLLGEAQFIVAQTPAAEREILRHAPRARTATVPNPVEIPANGHRRGTAGLVAFTGRLQPEKNLERLLDAWAHVVREVPSARLVIYGAGPDAYEQELRARARSSVAGSISFAGWVPDVAHKLSDVDVFVLPSVREGMSNSLLEACAARRIVVASDIEQNRAVLGDQYPLLFPVDDLDALAARLTTALTDADARQAALRQIEARLEKFRLDAVVDRYEELILEATHLSRH